jgi:8-oxo-dGTP pyrophosphatase MutT (NUDIX family)
MLLKTWKVVSSERWERLRIFGLRVDRAVSPRTGAAHDFYVLESDSWVNVIPITPEGKVVLIRQYRHGTREVTLEIPGGIVEAGDSPQEAARRELREETGYEAGEMVGLGFVHPNPAFLDNRCYTFLAQAVQRAGRQTQDEKEDIQVLLKPFAEIPRLIREGAITHALVVAAFYRLFMEHLPLDTLRRRLSKVTNSPPVFRASHR